jgi:hypothetical protein
MKLKKYRKHIAQARGTCLVLNMNFRERSYQDAQMPAPMIIFEIFYRNTWHLVGTWNTNTGKCTYDLYSILDMVGE